MYPGPSKAQWDSWYKGKGFGKTPAALVQEQEAPDAAASWLTMFALTEKTQTATNTFAGLADDHWWSDSDGDSSDDGTEEYLLRQARRNPHRNNRHGRAGVQRQ